MARYTGNDRVLTVQVNTTTSASLEIGTGNSGVRYTETVPENANPRVAHVAAAGSNAATTVAVSGSDVTVTLGTGATAGVVNATATQVKNAIDASPAASALVQVALLGDGTGVAAVLAMTALSGGGATVLNYVEVEFQTSMEISGENESIDSSHKGSNHAESFSGQASDSLSFECFDDDAEAVAVAQRQIKQARALRQLVYVQEAKKAYDANGNVTSITPIVGNEGRITSLSTTKNLNEMATFSVEMELQKFWTPAAA